VTILEATNMDAETPAPDASVDAPAGAGRTAWTRICRVDDLLVERGAAALVGDRQIALFRTFDGRIFATDQVDPFSGAAILSRGIVGDRSGIPTVASPMYKQVFDLRTGACLDTQGKEPLSVHVHPVAVHNGDVFVKLAAAANGAEGDPR
jgi:nitrite reductase (NADH) small subunit